MAIYKETALFRITTGSIIEQYLLRLEELERENSALKSGFFTGSSTNPLTRSSPDDKTHEISSRSSKPPFECLEIPASSHSEFSEDRSRRSKRSAESEKSSHLKTLSHSPIRKAPFSIPTRPPKPTILVWTETLSPRKIKAVVKEETLRGENGSP